MRLQLRFGVDLQFSGLPFLASVSIQGRSELRFLRLATLGTRLGLVMCRVALGIRVSAVGAQLRFVLFAWWA